VPLLGAANICLAPRLFPDDEPGLWMGLAFIVVFAAVTFIVSALSYNLFERRILAYKRFFGPRIAPPTLESIPVDSLTESAESVLS
jgi:peptidoglycan/LPS O-acetylase OafA/YrhL